MPTQSIRGVQGGKARRFQGSDVARDIESKYEFDGDLLQIYSGNKGAVVHKWHHYIPIYDRYFSRFRNTPLRFLEIGVSKGGSLQMWRRYFGPQAHICGIDIEPACARFDGQAGMVRIGSQDDPAFLSSVVEELGGIDVVLDDGSHHMAHIRASLEVLFPRLAEGGVYMIEDLHCAYWPRYGGGPRQSANFFNIVRALIDDMHRWYHQTPVRVPELDGFLSGVHVHDSIVVLEKHRVYPPVHSVVGSG
jgi:hypothetical protein